MLRISVLLHCALQVQAGSRLRVHYMSLGDAQDMHTPGMGEFHGGGGEGGLRMIL